MPLVVGVGERAGAPTVWTAEPGEAPAERPLAGAFRWKVSGERACIGRLEGGVHAPCPFGRAVVEHAQCPSCSGLEDPECVFEPRCQREGTACHCAFGPEPHVVYLAFFGTLPKVGMTLERRLHARLREQGADAYLAVERCADRGAARARERAIAYLHKVPEHRSHRETLPQLARPVPWPQVEARAAEWRSRLAGGQAPGPLHRIEDHPLRQPVPGVPRRVPAWGVHGGTWLGAKGNHLLYQGASRGLDVGSWPVVALKRVDLVGRRFEPL